MRRVGQYARFTFDRAEFHTASGRVELDYSFAGEPGRQVRFREQLAFDGVASPADPRLVDRALRAVHIIGGVSYYKADCPPHFDLGPHRLGSDEAAFYDRLYRSGLQEFLHVNRQQVAEQDLASFLDGVPCRASVPEAPGHPTDRVGRVLLPFGGGRESVLTAQLLRDRGLDVTLFRLRGHPRITETAQWLGLPLAVCERQLSANLLQMNRVGALNGHVPVTAFVLAVSLLYAVAHGFDSICMSNERDADEPTVAGTAINHQWSKSSEFEQAFRGFARDTLGAGTRLFNPARVAGSLAVSHLLARRYPDALGVVTSCNANWRLSGPAERRWCCRCAKCASTYLSLAPFFAADALQQTFEGAPLHDPEMLPLFRALLGHTPERPFECVAAPREIATAMRLLLGRPEYRDAPALVEYARLEGARAPESSDGDAFWERQAATLEHEIDALA